MLMIWFNKPHELTQFTPAYAFLVCPGYSTYYSITEIYECKVFPLVIGYFYFYFQFFEFSNPLRCLWA